MDPSWFSDFGFPSAVLLVILLGCWRTAAFLGPLIKDAFQSHLELVAALKIQSERQTGFIKSTVDELETHSELLREIAKSIHTSKTPVDCPMVKEKDESEAADI